MATNAISNATQVGASPEWKESVEATFRTFCLRLEQIGHETNFDASALGLPDEEMLKFTVVPPWVIAYIPTALQLIAPYQKNDMKRRCAFVQAFASAHNAALLRWIDAATKLELPEDKEFARLMEENGVTDEMLKRFRPDEKYVAIAQEYGILNYLLAEAGLKREDFVAR